MVFLSRLHGSLVPPSLSHAKHETRFRLAACKKWDKMTVQWTLLHSGSPLQVNDSFIALPNPPDDGEGGMEVNEPEPKQHKIKFCCSEEGEFFNPETAATSFLISDDHKWLAYLIAYSRGKGYGALSAPLDSPSNPVQGFVYYVCVL